MATFTGSLNDTKKFWFDSKGYSGVCLNDQIRAFLIAKLTLNTPSYSLTDMWRMYLKSLGRTEGSNTDMYKASLIAGIGGSATSAQSITDLELQFYGNSLNNFA